MKKNTFTFLLLALAPIASQASDPGLCSSIGEKTVTFKNTRILFHSSADLDIYTMPTEFLANEKTPDYSKFDAIHLEASYDRGVRTGSLNCYASPEDCQKEVAYAINMLASIRQQLSPNSKFNAILECATNRVRNFAKRVRTEIQQTP